MKSSFKRATASLVLAFSVAATPLAGPISEAYAGCNPQRASIVIEAETGHILSSYRADETRFPASMTKMMTLMLVFDAIRDGKLDLDQDLVMSASAAKMPPVKIGLRPGGKITLRDAISVTAVRSSNDLAVLLAEAVSGTEEDFAKLMTDKARAIGMKDTVFKNASGLPNSDHVTTARDMALLAQHLIKEYPKEYEYFTKRVYRYNGSNYYNTNRLIGSYGIDGIKTGYTCASGFNLAASAKRNGDRIIAITMGHSSSKSRNAHMVGLINKGFSQLRLDKAKGLFPVPLPTPKPDRDAEQHIAIPRPPSESLVDDKPFVVAGTLPRFPQLN